MNKGALPTTSLDAQHRSVLSIARVLRSLTNNAVLLEPLLLPFILAHHAPKRAHDVDVVGGRVEGVDGGDEDLVAPVHGEAAFAGRGVDAGLEDDGLEDGHGAAGGDVGGEADAGFIVVLRGGKGGEARALPGGVEEGGGDAALVEEAEEILVIEIVGEGGSLLEGVEGAEAVPGAASGPVLGHCEDNREARRLSTSAWWRLNR